MEVNQEKRQVREVVYLIDIDDEEPGRGQSVLALGLGGKLAEVVWSKDSSKFFLAWCPYPSIPKSVKEKMQARYLSGEGWR